MSTQEPVGDRAADAPLSRAADPAPSGTADTRPGQPTPSPPEDARHPSAATPAERLVRRLFTNHPLPMLVYDVETLGILAANDALTAAYGYTEGELLAMRVTDLLPPEDAPILARLIRETVRPGRPPYRPPALWRHVHKNGQVRDVEVAAHDYDFDGRDAVLVTISDVTERLRAERERDALLARLRLEAAHKAAIIAQMVDAVLVADGGGRIVLANQAAHELFDVEGDVWPTVSRGTTPAAALPWTLFDVHGRELAPEERPFIRAIRGETVRTEVRVVTARGRERWISVQASPLRDAHGEVSGVVWIGRETTEERSRREREIQGDKLRALGQLASGVAHDLNQYLGLVAGYGDLATRALDGAAPDLSTVRSALDVVVRAAMDGSESVKRLLAFARPTQDGPPEPVELGDLLREVATLTAPRWRDEAQQHGRAIAMIVEIDGATTVRGWPSALREALTNLVFNAVDALPDGGTISLAARAQDDRVIVTVADTGVGIPRDVLERVFEPFFSTKGARGTGLGLSIVHGIVERHQGSIAISCPPGGGTTVTLAFPRASTATAVTPPRVAGPAPARTGLRLLVVDDEPSITRMVSMMLAPYGHEVTVATSGEEALALLHRAAVPFDLIVSDLGMGDGMNGWDLLAQVRALAPATRFILSTGWGAQIDPTDVLARGGAGLLAKPYRLAELLRAVNGTA